MDVSTPPAPAGVAARRSTSSTTNREETYHIEDDYPSQVGPTQDDEDGDDLPHLREGISPADFSLTESFFSLCCFRPMEEAE